MEKVQFVANLGDTIYHVIRTFERAKWRLIFLDGFELRYPFPADATLKRNQGSST